MKYYYIEGSCGEREDTYTWAAGDKYFLTQAAAERYLMLLQIAAEVYNDAINKWGLIEHFKPLERLDSKAELCQGFIYYCLENKIINIYD